MTELTVRDITIGNDRPLVLIAGINVLEDGPLAMRVVEELVRVTALLGMRLIFKASFDKANRSSIHSYRGPGLRRGLRLLTDVRERFDVPVCADIHEPSQAEPVAEVCELLQIPAFLVRQTDLLRAACGTGRPLHLKKMQMMAPWDLGQVVAKCSAMGCDQVVLCERGTSFGYGRLIVDPLSFGVLKSLDRPVSFDVTHALQLPGALGESTGGRGHLAADLAVAGVSQGIAALFLEAHPEPAEARCDGPCATRLNEVESLLRRVWAVDAAVKGR